MSDPLLSSNDLHTMLAGQRGPPSPPWDDDDVFMDLEDVDKSVTAVTDVDDFLSYSPTSLRLDSDTDEAISSFLKSSAEDKVDVSYLDDDPALRKSSVNFWKDFCDATTDDLGGGVLCTACNVTFASMESVSRHSCDALFSEGEGSSLASFAELSPDAVSAAPWKSVDDQASVYVDGHCSTFLLSDEDSDSKQSADGLEQADAASPRSEVGHCSVCKLVFATAQKLEAHRKAFAAKVACCHCSKSFANASKLRIHHRKHSKEKPFQCQCCGKYYMHRNTLVRHQQLYCLPLRGKLDEQVEQVIAEIDLDRDHDKMTTLILDALEATASAKKERPKKKEVKEAKSAETSCRICDSEFFDLQSLDNHRDYHLKQRTCCRCHKVMVSRSKLLIHQRSHTKELPYACGVCDRSFAEKSTLRKHAATHGERNFRCDACDKAFVRKDYLAKHQLTHRQTYKCSQCSFVCYNRLDIERHVAVHPAA
jgi:KRAB domain-containing zinc finger protein